MSNCEGKSCESCAGRDKKSDQELLQCKLSRIKHKLLVMSGKGGVGKSSTAVYLALALAEKGHKVGLMDIDLHGPSIPGMLGIEGLLECSPDRKLVPYEYRPNLKVISMGCLLQDRDSAVIWRGPVKHGVIQQFITECEWDDLDFLVIDSPPGTGDEPMSIAQIIPDAKAVIVTTPQEVALADVRKSINFCRKVNLEIVGLVENMSGLYCPHCRELIPIFRTGGGRKTAEQMDVFLLGSLPFEPAVVAGGDQGRPVLEGKEESPFKAAVHGFADAVVDRLEPSSEDRRKKVV